MLGRLDFWPLPVTQKTTEHSPLHACIRIQAQAGNKGANCHHQATSLSSWRIFAFCNEHLLITDFKRDLTLIPCFPPSRQQRAGNEKEENVRKLQ